MNARLPAGLIAAIAWIGLGVQFRASLASFPTITATLWAMLLYFTVIANLLVALLFTGIAFGWRRAARPLPLGGATICILLVGIVYNVLLRGMVELSGGAKLADFLNHTLTPILVTAYWLFAVRRGGLNRRAPWLWAIVPLLYFGYGLLRAHVDGRYPYPFMDVGRLGWGRTLLNAAVMAIAFVVVGHAMLWWDRRQARPSAPWSPPGS